MDINAVASATIVSLDALRRDVLLTESKLKLKYTEAENLFGARIRDISVMGNAVLKRLKCEPAVKEGNLKTEQPTNPSGGGAGSLDSLLGGTNLGKRNQQSPRKHRKV